MTYHCYNSVIATDAIDYLTSSEQRTSPTPHHIIPSPITRLHHVYNYTVLIKHFRPTFQNFSHSSSCSCRKHRHWCLSPVPASSSLFLLPSLRSLAFFFFFFLRVVVVVFVVPFPCTDSKSVFSELQNPSVS